MDLVSSSASNTILIALESPPLMNKLKSCVQKPIRLPKDAPPQSQWLTKTPSQNYILREHYRDPWNEVRIGRSLQDLDALATTISVKHCSDDGSKTRPLFLVTAAVDKIVLKKPLSVSIDMKIVGNVIWVGRSSIEIQLEVTQPSQEDPEDDSDSVALTATFICVAIDSKTGEAVPVNRILPETKQEKALLEETEAQNSLRKSKRGKELVNGEVLITKNRVEAMLAEGWIFNNIPSFS
ncbi:unnamed protein product [Prunus armeniaca]|uniref:HotDog ACOT-type domain-containing protein n=1 Tax=Prunus armeniaca TaxID=36596 RepID=A0A6J5YCV8_PRUAR|nr:unnamed protein product [Prunus armeniaca]